MVLWLKTIDSTVFLFTSHDNFICPVIQMSPPETKAQGDIFQKRSILQVGPDWFRYNHEIDPKRWL